MADRECSVLVCSCDKYADLLPQFIALYRKYWPDCPFETVLVTESACPIDGFDRVIACGKGGNWCSRLVQALDGISSPYVLMLCDDYFLEKKVDTPLLLHLFERMKSSNALNLRMIPNPALTPRNSSPVSSQSPQLYSYRKRTAYCVATQSGFWDRRFLRRLAAKTNSIWEFERYGSYDFEPAEEDRPILVTTEKVFPFIDAVHKGCWETWGVKCLRDNGIPVDLSKRGLPSLSVRFKEAVKRFIWNLNPDLVTRVQNRFGLGAKEVKPNSTTR